MGLEYGAFDSHNFTNAGPQSPMSMLIMTSIVDARTIVPVSSPAVLKGSPPE